ncbi:hypothetical protein GQ43DRAFT_278777 [Delitschia confertaspora ATCC 74209]|uniref:Uncharacterized protein n=1 Tax=Delitschia confertaspora ATCC 74209 TaxID=1513339 RepID=A0A9P4JVB0_9PLEO|nr:hypothetical protein GQ43DRAFT_278777 [Delitschia confertaspora ATCC 74209]
MSKAVIYKWEDPSTLQHHCGVCERPLHHPAARTSCFGTHGEPCRRFHQGMFMPGRSHQCLACGTADETHHRRHCEIAEALRGIYESCGFYISLIPPHPEAPLSKYPRLYCQDNENIPFAATQGSTKLTKRERKAIKKMAKVTSRVRVITTPEIEYLGSVLHLPDVNGDNSYAPSSVEEFEEIERNLRYNANVYTNGMARKVIKGIAHLRDIDVDFNVDTTRIFGVLRITELVQRTTKNGGLGLCGKELRLFEDAVATLNKSVVEDLVLLKREEIETRMRRAGYLRYVKRESFNILIERHKEIDWKTAEKIVQNGNHNQQKQRGYNQHNNTNPTDTNKASAEVIVYDTDPSRPNKVAPPNWTGNKGKITVADEELKSAHGVHVQDNDEKPTAEQATITAKKAKKAKRNNVLKARKVQNEMKAAESAGIYREREERTQMKPVEKP